MKFKVQFFKGTRAQYDSISPDRYTFYFITDTDQVYLGGTELTNTDFSELQRQIYALAQEVNEIKQGTVKIITITDLNKEQIQSQISEKDRFYLYIDADGHGSPDLKVGDGTSYVGSIPFLSRGSSLKFESLSRLLQDHIQDNNKHIQQMEYISDQDKRQYGYITERDYWNDKVTAYTVHLNNEGEEEYIPSSQITDGDSLCLKLDNSSIIVKDNIPKRIQLRN